MPRFAILEHDHPTLHWDLLLEHGPTCRTWRLAAPPSGAGEIAAEAIADHRPMYLDYSGPVSGDRGAVQQWDAGRCVWLADLAERASVLLAGKRWSGRVDLIVRNGLWVAILQPRKTTQAGDPPA